MNVLIIGASRGIGYELARQSLEAGDTVRLKAGFKFFTALSEVQVTLTQ